MTHAPQFDRKENGQPQLTLLCAQPLRTIERILGVPGEDDSMLLGDAVSGVKNEGDGNRTEGGSRGRV